MIKIYNFRVYLIIALLFSIAFKAQTICAINQGSTGNGQGMIDYNGDNPSNRYANGGEAPNNYASFFTAEDLKIAEGVSSGYGNTGAAGTTLNTTFTASNITYYGMTGITNTFQTGRYFSFRVTTSSNSPLIRLNRFRIGTIGTFGTNAYDSDLGYSYKLDIYDESAGSTANVIADNATNATSNNTDITFTLLPGKSYVFKLYLRNTNGRTNTYIDNPTLYAYALPNINTTNYTACSSGTVSTVLSPVVSSGTPNNMQLRWIQGSTNVSANTIAAGTYTPYYFNTTGNCYHPAGSAVTVTIGTATSVTSQPSPANQNVCQNNASTAISVSANGTNLTYQWYSNTTNSNIGGSLISGAVSNTYTPPSTVLGNIYYYVIITGSCGTITSNTASVAVNAIPPPPSVSITPPTCSAPGSATISNYNASNTYAFTPAGPTVGTGGAISNMTPGTNYIVAANNGNCTSADSSSFSIAPSVNCVCYNNGNFTSAGSDSKVGITSLKRAGATDSDNWPMVRKSAHLVLESNTKGFVITRMATAALGGITNPQEGMMIYDTNAKCLKIYSDGAWKCFSTPSCP